MNNSLASASVVRRTNDDDENAKPKKKTHILCSQHADQVKAAAERYGWVVVEFEELFGQVSKKENVVFMKKKSFFL